MDEKTNKGDHKDHHQRKGVKVESDRGRKGADAQPDPDRLRIYMIGWRAAEKFDCHQ